MNRSTTVRHRARQQGAATLVVVMVLFFLVLLVAAYSARTLIFEQRTSANQYRSAQAYEAAQAGLEWALAMLNSNQRIDTACQPTLDASADTFRDRYLAAEIDNARVRPATSGTLGRFAACMKTEEGWQCQCPNAELTTVLAEASTSVGFLVEMPPVISSAPAGPLQIVSRACSSPNDSRCFTDGTSVANAYAIQTVQVALVPVLRQQPIAALTVHAAMSAPGAGAIFVNTDAGGNATAIQSSGNIPVELASSLVLPGGVPPESALLGNDTSMGEQGKFFTRYMGISRTIYRELPGVTNLACAPQECGTALVTAAGAGARLFHRDGDLTLPAGTTLGSPEKPVVLVVTGRLTLEGLAQVTGLVYSSEFAWVSAATASSIRGAVVVEVGCCADVTGAPQFIYDRDVLSRLQLTAGAYARVPGSWQDR